MADAGHLDALGTAKAEVFAWLKGPVTGAKRTAVAGCRFRCYLC